MGKFVSSSFLHMFVSRDGRKRPKDHPNVFSGRRGKRSTKGGPGKGHQLGCPSSSRGERKEKTSTRKRGLRNAGKTNQKMIDLSGGPFSFRGR